MFKAIWLGLLAIVVIAAFAILIWGLATGFQYATAPVRGAVGMREITMGSGEFRRSAYDHFFNLCASIQGDMARLRAVEDELEDSVTSTRKSQLNASSTAIKANIGEKIARYNGDAAKDFTIGQFRAESLPYHIDRNAEEVKCVVND